LEDAVNGHASQLSLLMTAHMAGQVSFVSCFKRTPGTSKVLYKLVHDFDMTIEVLFLRKSSRTSGAAEAYQMRLLMLLVAFATKRFKRTFGTVIFYLFLVNCVFMMLH